MKTHIFIVYILLGLTLALGFHNYFENTKLQEKLELSQEQLNLSEANIATMVDFVNKKFESFK